MVDSVSMPDFQWDEAMGIANVEFIVNEQGQSWTATFLIHSKNAEHIIWEAYEALIQKYPRLLPLVHEQQKIFSPRLY